MFSVHFSKDVGKEWLGHILNTWKAVEILFKVDVTLPPLLMNKQWASSCPILWKLGKILGFFLMFLFSCSIQCGVASHRGFNLHLADYWQCQAVGQAQDPVSSSVKCLFKYLVCFAVEMFTLFLLEFESPSTFCTEVLLSCGSSRYIFWCVSWRFIDLPVFWKECKL